MQILQKSSYVVTAGSSSRNTSVLAHHTFFPKAKQSARNSSSSTNATHIFVGVPNIFHVHTFVDFNPLETVVS